MGNFLKALIIVSPICLIILILLLHYVVRFTGWIWTWFVFIFVQSQMIICLTELLQNFAQVEYRRYKYTVNLQKQRASSSDYLPDMCVGCKHCISDKVALTSNNLVE